jgi:hypothetical protein
MEREQADQIINHECEAAGISREVFENALNSVSPYDLTEAEIIAHAKWCAENVD